MKPDWLQDNETILGSWAVYVGEPTPTSPKITGTLHVTDCRVVFASTMELPKDAGLGLLSRHQVYRTKTERWEYPYGQIRKAEIVKKKLFIKSLLLTLDSGDQADFTFGAASPAKALEAIRTRLAV